MDLSVCDSKTSFFCFHYLDCYQNGALSFTKKYDTVFILEDFVIGKVRERFKRHEKSASHKELVFKLKSMQGPSIITQLSARNQAEHQSMLLKQLQSLKFLLRQGLPIRGLKEIEGNLKKCKPVTVLH